VKDWLDRLRETFVFLSSSSSSPPTVMGNVNSAEIGVVGTWFGSVFAFLGFVLTARSGWRCFTSKSTPSPSPAPSIVSLSERDYGLLSASLFVLKDIERQLMLANALTLVLLPAQQGQESPSSPQAEAQQPPIDLSELMEDLD
jgi:hypothetical protein